jgi:hypothetical protein
LEIVAVEWLFEILLEVVGYFVWTGEDREWSMLKISIWLAVVIIVTFLLYMYFG